jgi:hypothetical protein
MARNHARLLLSIWDDPDWLKLTSSQHDVYLALLSSRDLSWCGVAPLLPQRLAHVSADMTERKARSALAVLSSARFLVIDEASAEVAVRSYVRHDDFLKQPNVVKAMIKDLRKVHSRMISKSVAIELGRAFKEDPDLKGWATIRLLDRDLFAAVSANGSANPSANPFGKGSANPFGNPSENP